MPRVTRRAVDFSKSGSLDNVCRQAEIDDIEQVEKFCSKLKIHEFAAASRAERRILDQPKIEVM